MARYVMPKMGLAAKFSNFRPIFRQVSAFCKENLPESNQELLGGRPKLRQRIQVKCNTKYFKTLIADSGKN